MYRNTYDPNLLPGTFICRTDIGHEIKDYYPEDYVVIDLETTGLNPATDEIIEICALRYSDNCLVDEYNALVKPSKPVPVEITLLTGIDNKMLGEAEAIERALTELQSFIGDTYVLGYCVDFDTSFIHHKMLEHLETGFTNWYVDVHNIAKTVLPGFEHYRQIDVCKALKIAVKGAHRAKNDCLMCNEVYQALKERHIEGYVKPCAARASLKVTENGLRTHPFSSKHFYLLGTFAESTKYNVADILIGLGAKIDNRFTDNTNYVIVGMAEAYALESTEMRTITEKKKAGGNIFIIKEMSFLEALINKNYIKKSAAGKVVNI